MYIKNVRGLCLSGHVSQKSISVLSGITSCIGSTKLLQTSAALFFLKSWRNPTADKINLESFFRRRLLDYIIGSIVQSTDQSMNRYETAGLLVSPSNGVYVLYPSSCPASNALNDKK